jgi:hypothetical protein
MNKSLSNEIVVLNGEGSFGVSYNFFLKRDEQYYNLVSFMMMKDGSLVVFKKGDKSTKVWSGNILSARTGQRNIKFKDFPVRDLEKSDNAGKITFHTSGVVNSSSGRVVRESLRTMDVTQPLCTIIHKHVDNMKPVLLKENYKNVNFYVESNDELENYLQTRIFLSSKTNNIIEKYYQNGTIASVNVVYKGESLEHSDKMLFAQILLEKGPRVIEGQKSDKELTLIIHLADQLVPKHLKPKLK